MVDTVTLDRDTRRKNALTIFPIAKIVPQGKSRTNLIKLSQQCGQEKL
jgi:hypothetical protein